VHASPGPELPGARWLRRPCFGAAVGAPLGEWRGWTKPGSPNRAAGWTALAPPGWASWDTGRQLAIQGGDPWSPRAPRLSGKRARRYGPGGPHWKPRLGRARGENRAAPAEQQPAGHPGTGRSARLHVCLARGATFPTASLGQACLPDRTRPLSVASHGPLLHGCASLLVPDVRPTLAWRILHLPVCLPGAMLRRACEGGVGSVLGRSCHADRVRSSSSSYASQQFSIHLRYPATLSNS
jgi:hypothetical protein